MKKLFVLIVFISALLPVLSRAACIAPTLTSITPGSGSISGSTKFVIMGANFCAGATVNFGTVQAALTMITATEIVGTTPVNPAGPVTVMVTNPGIAPVSFVNQFVYLVPNPTFVVNAGNAVFGSAGHKTYFNGYARGGNPPYTFLWDFKDGGTATTMYSTHIYPNAGTFEAVIYVTDSLGAVASSSTYAYITSMVTSGTFESLMSSTVFRIDTSTIKLGAFDPPGAALRVQPLLSDEVANNMAFTNNARLVPDPVYDNDGRWILNSINSTIASNQDWNYGFLSTVVGRPTVVCGLTGTIAARVADCASQNGEQADWRGTYYGQAGEGNWNLVTLYSATHPEGSACTGGETGGCFEVWQDQRTQLIWSDLMTGGHGYAGWVLQGYNWFQAAGYSSSTTTIPVTGAEAKAGAGTSCAVGTTAVACQPIVPISVCANASSIAGLNGVPTYQNPDGTNGTYDERPSKGQLAITWLLPTREDWEMAEVDGIRKVLPGMTSIFPTSSSDSSATAIAWFINMGYGVIGQSLRSLNYPVRCIGLPGSLTSPGLTGVTASNAYRIDTSTINLGTLNPPVSGRVQPLLLDEVSHDAAFTANSRLVPEPKFDSDGRYSPVSGAYNLFYGYLQTVKGRPTIVCGLDGTTAEQVADCATRNGTKAIWQGALYGQSGEGDWKLVTLYSSTIPEGGACIGGATAGCFEVWQDQRTMLVWSDMMSGNDGGGYRDFAWGYNWFQAAGYSSSTSTKAITNYEAQAGGGSDCTAPCQPIIPISVCADATSLAGLNGVPVYQNPDGTNGTQNELPSKGGIQAGRHWRLPTKDDWLLADVNGIRKVLPNMTQTFWSSSSDSLFTWGVWGFRGDNGTLQGIVRYTMFPVVRCVGH